MIWNPGDPYPQDEEGNQLPPEMGRLLPSGAIEFPERGWLKTPKIQKLVQARIPLHLFLKLEKLAKEDGKTIAGYLRHLINTAIDTKEEKKNA